MHSINLMDAYVIEMLRSHGVSNETILEETKNKNTETFQSVKENMDFTTLELLEASGNLESILKDGYQVTFLTSNGLKNLIRMKYGKKADEDFTFNDFVVRGLEISDDETKELEALLSQNWNLSKDEDGVTIAPVN